MHIVYTDTSVIACGTVMEEMIPFLPPQVSYQILDFGLHINPRDLKIKLQNAINATPDNIRNIILGYGLCSQAVLGLKSQRSRLIIPRVDDCIAIFLGSGAAYLQEQRCVPGTYYVTKGWLKTASTPFDGFEELVKQYGDERARDIMNNILKNYTRLAFINTGSTDLDDYHWQAKNIALKFGLKYEEIQGSDSLVKKMIFGPLDSDFVILEPGETASFSSFRQNPITV